MLMPSSSSLRRGHRMRRRDVIGGLAGTAAWPRHACAQAALPLIGFLNSASAETYRFNADSFRDGLQDAGFVEGSNVRITEQWAEGDYQALPRPAADLVAAGAAVIAATGDVASARAAQAASATVPVVFTIGADLVARVVSRPSK